MRDAASSFLFSSFSAFVLSMIVVGPTDKRAAKALRSIQQQIQQREQAQFEQHQSLLEQEMLGILRAGARDEATTTDEQPRSTVPTRNARFEQLFAAWRPDQRALTSVSLGEASACP